MMRSFVIGWQALAATALVLGGCGDKDRPAPTDTGVVDTGVVDTGVAPDTGVDTGVAPDTGVADGSVDTGVADGSVDTGVADGSVDTGVADGSVDTGVDGGADTGTADTGTADTGTADTGTADTGTADTGTPDTGTMMTDAGPICADMDLGMVEGLAVATGTTVGAVNDFATSSCGGGGGSEDMAFFWTAPRDGSYAFDTNGSGYDTALFVLAGNDCMGAELGCNDDGGATSRSNLNLTLTAGTTVTVVVDGYSGFGTSEGTFELNITEAPTAETGLCGDMLDNDRDGDTDCADSDCSADAACTETGAECADMIDNDGDGDIDCADSDCGTEPACTETGAECSDMIDNDGDMDIDCADSDCATDPACTETGAECGDMLDNDGDGDIDCADRDCIRDAGGLCDNCPTADLMGAVGMGVTMGTTVGELDSRQGSCDSGTSGPDVGYTFTAPMTGEYIIDTNGSGYDTLIFVRNASCLGLELDCDDDGGTSLQSLVTIPLAMGQTVVIVVDGYSPTTSGTFVLNIAGMSVTYANPTMAGEVVITEIMQNPNVLSDGSGEWFEVYNPSSTATYDLQGCTFTDLSTTPNSITIVGPLLIAPGQYLALATAGMPGFVPSYDYNADTFFLGNSGDEVIMTCGTTEIDRVEYDSGATFPDPTGASMSLDRGSLTSTGNDMGANWCEGTDSYNGDLGTPGSRNPFCP